MATRTRTTKTVNKSKSNKLKAPQKGIYLYYPDKKVALIVEGVDCIRFETMPQGFNYDIPCVKITHKGHSELIVGIPFSVITPD